MPRMQQPVEVIDNYNRVLAAITELVIEDGSLSGRLFEKSGASVREGAKVRAGINAFRIAPGWLMLMVKSGSGRRHPAFFVPVPCSSAGSGQKGYFFFSYFFIDTKNFCTILLIHIFIFIFL